jgi:hypothetical protein
MKAYSILLVFVVFNMPNLLAQEVQFLQIKKNSGRTVRTIKMPLKVRIRKTNFEIVKFKLDSIKNGIWYGERGRYRIAITDINAVNIPGIKETIKYSASTLSAMLALGGFFLMTHAYGNSNYETPTGTSLMGAGYMIICTPISILIYNYPRTRYKTARFEFIMK